MILSPPGPAALRLFIALAHLTMKIDRDLQTNDGTFRRLICGRRDRDARPAEGAGQQGVGSAGDDVLAGWRGARPGPAPGGAWSTAQPGWSPLEEGPPRGGRPVGKGCGCGPAARFGIDPLHLPTPLV